MRPELKKIIDNIASQSNLVSDKTDCMMKEMLAISGDIEERREAGAYLAKAIARRKRPDVDVKGILGETAEALNLSYIARRYFDKDRTWLYQRLNHSVVNGKPTAFSESEIKILADSLTELSNKINQVSIQLTHH